ncbi:MAG: fibronectin type III domain-containing protein [archaeon]|nr:fibronectin type III domain-containing protein [archaeon]
MKQEKIFFVVFFTLFLGLVSAQTIGIKIANDANYTNQEKPNLTITIDGNTSPATEMYFSCVGDGQYLTAPFAYTYADFSIINSQYNCDIKDGPKSVYVKVSIGEQITAPVSDSITLDRSVTSITFISPENGSQSESRVVAFELNDSLSGINVSQTVVTINGVQSTSFSPSSNCAQSDTKYNCLYTENKFDMNNTLYNINVLAKDNAGNQLQKDVNFTYLDTNAPVKVTGLAATPGNGQVSLSWTASTDYDLKEYLVYMGTASSFDTNSATLIATVAAGTTNTTKTSLDNGTTYYFKVSAKDKSGLEGTDSDEKNAAPAENASNIPAPAINSSTHTNDVWSTNNDPVFSWDVNSSRTYKCVFDQNSGTIPSSDCSSPRNPDGTQEGVWYFHLKSCDSSGNCSSTSHFKAKIDRTGPQQVTGLSVEANSDGTITLRWNSVSDNPSGENSGIREYQVYRHFDDDFDAIDSRRIAGTGSTSYIDDGDDLTEGTRYYYKIRAVDNQDNAGSLSSESSAIFLGENVCENEFSFNFTDYIGGEKFAIIVTAESPMTAPVLKVRIVDGQTGFIQADDIDTTSTSVTGIFPLAGLLHEKNAEVTINSTDSQGNQCFELKRASIDRQNPTISFAGLEEGSDLLLNSDISITASDAHSGIKEVKIYYRQRQADFSLLGNASNTGDTFNLSSDDLQGIIPGEVELKAEATDNVGNKEEVILTLTAKTSDAVLGQQEFEFTSDLSNALKGKGIAEEFASRAASLFEKTRPIRTLEVLRENGEIKARVTISFANNGAGNGGFKIIEVIPKSFAETAGKITSSNSFNVLVDDPVIEFEVGTIDEGGIAVVSYELKESLSEEQAQELLQENVLSGFELPPLVVEESEDTGEIFSAKPQFVQPDLFFVLVLVIIIIVFLIFGFVAIGGAAIFHIHKKSRESQIDKKLSEMEGSMMQKTSGQLKKWLEKKEAEKPKKFSWQPPKK